MIGMTADFKRPEEAAVARHKIISPVLMAMDEGADGAKLAHLQEETCRVNEISRRTLRRWLTAYHEKGFEGLKPMPRKNQHGTAIPEDIIQEAILLRREVPGRSIPQLIEIFEYVARVEHARRL